MSTDRFAPQILWFAAAALAEDLAFEQVWGQRPPWESRRNTAAHAEAVPAGYAEAPRSDTPLDGSPPYRRTG